MREGYRPVKWGEVKEGLEVYFVVGHSKHIVTTRSGNTWHIENGYGESWDVKGAHKFLYKRECECEDWLVKIIPIENSPENTIPKLNKLVYW